MLKNWSKMSGDICGGIVGGIVGGIIKGNKKPPSHLRAGNFLFPISRQLTEVFWWVLPCTAYRGLRSIATDRSLYRLVVKVLNLPTTLALEPDKVTLRACVFAERLLSTTLVCWLRIHVGVSLQASLNQSVGRSSR
jgi:hypothetical protein